MERERARAMVDEWAGGCEQIPRTKISHTRSPTLFDAMQTQDCKGASICIHQRQKSKCKVRSLTLSLALEGWMHA